MGCGESSVFLSDSVLEQDRARIRWEISLKVQIDLNIWSFQGHHWRRYCAQPRYHPFPGRCVVKVTWPSIFKPPTLQVGWRNSLLFIYQLDKNSLRTLRKGNRQLYGIEIQHVWREPAACLCNEVNPENVGLHAQGIHQDPCWQDSSPLQYHLHDAWSCLYIFIFAILCITFFPPFALKLIPQ